MREPRYSGAYTRLQWNYTLDRSFPDLRRNPQISQSATFQDKESKRRAILARFAPGAKLPRHKHVGDELIFVVEGSNADESGEVVAGNMNYRPNGCVHSVSTKNGATVLAVVTGGVEMMK